MKEYYYHARAEGRQKTDSEYVDDLKRLTEGKQVELVIVDPSAASFIEALRRQGWTVRKADNRVLEGIRRTAQALQKGEIVICKGCDAAAREFSMYCWDLKSGQDKVKKEYDHAMDEIRYFVMAMEQEPPVAAMVVERHRF